MGMVMNCPNKASNLWDSLEWEKDEKDNFIIWHHTHTHTQSDNTVPTELYPWDDIVFENKLYFEGTIEIIISDTYTYTYTHIQRI